MFERKKIVACAHSVFESLNVQLNFQDMLVAAAEIKCNQNNIFEGHELAIGFHDHWAEVTAEVMSDN